MKESEAKQDRRHEDAYPAQPTASDTFQIRRATARDADIIAWHRARMFQDMGDVSGDAFEILRANARSGWKNGSIRRITSAGLQLPQMNRN
jgi:hypothetical protein